MTLADELMGRVEVADMPDSPRRVERIEDEDLHRSAVGYVPPIAEPEILPFLGVGARGEILCLRTEIDRRRA